MVLLGICVVALLIGLLRITTQRTPLPTGSSYSSEPNGALALFTWLEAEGGTLGRISDSVIRGDQAPATLVILQPESPFDANVGQAFDTVPQHGGTLVVAGDSLAWLLYTRSLGVAVEPIRSGATRAVSTDNTLHVSLLARYRLRADGAAPLLVTPDGDWLALRMPYKDGTLVVLATPEPLLNESLHDESMARFVYREVVAGAASGTIAFDEAHHSFAPPNIAGAPATLSSLLFDTAPGRAVLYVSVLAFLAVLFSGWRLGPALPARPPSETHRTMFEHVQMLANLYRRAGQLPVARDTFSRHYQRVLARAAGSPKRAARLSEALVRIESARTESDLISAVASARDAS
jgi:hypothetical protein